MATAASVYRDYETDGVPSSGAHKPHKPEIRTLLSGYEAIINAFTANGGLIYSSLAALNADLAHAANSMAWVIGDATVANNGVYGKVGASGAGSWTRRSDLPFSFIIASDAGAGTANAIQATTSIPVSGSALVWMNIFEANTASPVTVSFNGGSALTIKTNSGNDVAVGGLTAGMIVLGIVSGSTFRLVSDQASSAVLAAAEAAQAAAEAAATAALAAANAGFVFDTEADFVAANIPAALQFIEVAGYYAPSDGGGHRKKRVATPSPAKAWHKQSADGAWWEVEYMEPATPAVFGALATDPDSSVAFQAAFDFAQYCGHEWTKIGAGFWTIDGAKFTWDSSRLGVRVEGVNQGLGTIVAFVGTPTKVKCTRENWVAAYDSGASFDEVDYSASTDAAIAWGFKFGGYYCQMNDMAVYLQWPSNEVVNPPVNWGADYDVGVMYQARYFSSRNLRVTGSWRRAGLLEDHTQWNASTDRAHLVHSEFSGNWGFESMGPKGNAGANLHANDRRGVGGNSDHLAEDCGFYSIRRNHSPAGGMVRPPWTATYAGGAMKRSGQAPNTGGKGQGHRYVGCRFHTVSRFMVYLDYDSRTEFFGCRFEGQAGFASDGVTPLNTANTSASDFRLEFTANSTRTRIFGGEASGCWVQDDQPNLLGVAAGAAYIGGGARVFGTEFNVDASEYFSNGSRGTWSPMIVGATVAGTQTGTFQGHWIKNGRLLTCFFICNLTGKTGTGAVRITGLPLSAYAIQGMVDIAQYQGITFAANYDELIGAVGVGDQFISLGAGSPTGLGYINLDMSALAATAFIRGKVDMITEF